VAERVVMPVARFQRSPSTSITEKSVGCLKGTKLTTGSHTTVTEGSACVRWLRGHVTESSRTILARSETWAHPCRGRVRDTGKIGCGGCRSKWSLGREGGLGPRVVEVSFSFFCFSFYLNF
jgi:hypothetical protein